jgi:hypothetical protein
MEQSKICFNTCSKTASSSCWSPSRRVMQNHHSAGCQTIYVVLKQRGKVVRGLWK